MVTCWVPVEGLAQPHGHKKRRQSLDWEARASWDREHLNCFLSYWRWNWVCRMTLKERIFQVEEMEYGTTETPAPIWETARSPVA